MFEGFTKGVFGAADKTFRFVSSLVSRMRSYRNLVVAVIASVSALLLGAVIPETWPLRAGVAVLLSSGLALCVSRFGARLRKLLSTDEVSVLTSASHEIRTPLNGILGLTQLLLKMRPTAQQREHLEAIKTSGESLHRIINDVLDYSKIRTGKLHFETEPFRLRRRIRRTIQTLAPQAHLKEVELAFWVDSDVPDRLTGDPDRLNQVLTNLLVNAIKFTDEGEVYLEVSLEHLDEGGDEVTLRFVVMDTGIGIADAQKRRIFDAFAQAGGVGVERGGIGLGLAIARELVECMGGTIELESEMDRGSKFCFSARFGAQGSESAEDGVMPGEPVKDFSLLVVDDSPWQRKVLERQLQSWGFGVTTAGDADTAIRLSGEQSFSLLLLDSRIPGVETWSLASSLEARGARPGILMTLAHEHVDTDVLRSHGFLGYLHKPIAPTHLLRAIEIIRRGVAIETPEAVQTQNMDRLALGGRRILVAEDHPVNRTVVVHMLERAGCEVVAVENGREALEIVDEEVFSLALVDVEMPEVDGLTVAKRIRERETGSPAHLPLIALTAKARAEDQARCLEAGMDAFLSKPYEEEELWSLMRRFLNQDDKPKDTRFDRSRALERASGDEALLAELSRLFLDDVSETLSAMTSSLAASDSESLERLAHRLKGSLMTLSARPAGEAALALEKAARRKSIAECQALLEELTEELARLEPLLIATAGEVKSP